MKIRSVLIISMFGILVVVGLPVLSVAAPSALPPRPTPSLTPTATPIPNPPSLPAPPTGGYIVLRVPSAQKEMWTLVQWQDGLGDWHDVTGWQGTFDEIQNGVGEKMWWVAEENFGQGPFRWAIYQSQGGERLTTSEMFNLPAGIGEWLVTKVALSPES